MQSFSSAQRDEQSLDDTILYCHGRQNPNAFAHEPAQRSKTCAILDNYFGVQQTSQVERKERLPERYEMLNRMKCNNQRVGGQKKCKAGGHTLPAVYRLQY